MRPEDLVALLALLARLQTALTSLEQENIQLQAKLKDLTEQTPSDS